ncbi:hypothetical protein [Shimia sediminis]|uniref:hypothetical protein n=1 Tax=Shimia sediminis TaxID=2497945 RepID=UPI0013DF991B|nr:hypothetical protein [Shimia sediminis]
MAPHAKRCAALVFCWQIKAVDGRLQGALLPWRGLPGLAENALIQTRIAPIPRSSGNSS